MRFYSKLNKLFGSDLDAESTEAEVDAVLDTALDAESASAPVIDAVTITAPVITAPVLSTSEVIADGGEGAEDADDNASADAPVTVISVNDMATQIGTLTEQLTNLTQLVSQLTTQNTQLATQTQEALNGLATQFGTELNALKLKSNEPATASGRTVTIPTKGKESETVVASSFIDKWIN